VQLDGRTIQGDSYRYGYQGSEKDDEAKGSGNSYTTFFRQLDPRVGRWFSVDPKLVAGESPYVSMGNNPVYFNDVFGDSIPARFYNSSGIQTNSIPEDFQNSFRQEYGITLGYENGKLFKSGDFNTSNKVSPDAKNMWESLLGENNPEEGLVFGYNLANTMLPTKGKPTLSDPIVFGNFINGTAYIDLADFEYGEIKGNTVLTNGNGGFNSRMDNLARIIEHEYLGHGIMDLSDGPSKNDVNKLGGVENYLNTFRVQMGVPQRVSYEYSTENRVLPTMLNPNINPVWKVSRDYKDNSNTYRMYYDREPLGKMVNYIGNH